MRRPDGFEPCIACGLTHTENECREHRAASERVLVLRVTDAERIEAMRECCDWLLGILADVQSPTTPSPKGHVPGERA